MTTTSKPNHHPRLIVLPLAGQGSRFVSCGIHKPKPLLEVGQMTVLDHILSKVSRDQAVLVILRDDSQGLEIERWLRANRKDIFISKIAETRGQLESVVHGIRIFKKQYDQQIEDFAIFNGDTIRKIEFIVPSRDYPWIEVTRASGTHWSFVDVIGKVSRVVEKNRISELCSTGLYYFPSFKDFMEQLQHSCYLTEFSGESFVAPFYQILIDSGVPVYSFFEALENFDFCGTPDEYFATAQKWTKTIE
jgi:NDP-sugar pyrophosphorylase family protein